MWNCEIQPLDGQWVKLVVGGRKDSISPTSLSLARDRKHFGSPTKTTDNYPSPAHGGGHVWCSKSVASGALILLVFNVVGAIEYLESLRPPAIRQRSPACLCATSNAHSKKLSLAAASHPTEHASPALATPAVPPARHLRKPISPPLAPRKKCQPASPCQRGLAAH